MIFGTDGKILKINPNKTQLDNNLDPKYQSEMSEYATLNKSKNDGCYYSFPSVKYLTEKDAIDFFRESYIRSLPFQKEEAKYRITPEYAIDRMKLYIIPKLYYYFPFLDCDSEDEYHYCCSELSNDNIQYQSYISSLKENKHKYWIFCDLEFNFDECLKFLLKYPCDQKYTWVASYKKEFCVRALPKKGFIIKKQENEYKFSSNFQHWIKDFDNYWENGEIINRIKMILVSNNI